MNKYEDLLRKYSYSVRIQENMDQKKLRMWTLFRQCVPLREPKQWRICKFLGFITQENEKIYFVTFLYVLRPMICSLFYKLI